jgi:hypothetical protein
MPTKTDRSQIWVSEDQIKNMTGPKNPEFDQRTTMDKEEDQGIISYLFKRDKWESKAQWKVYYDKLKHLCKRGVPPHNRISLWSELGRAVYFINLTEFQHKKLIGMKKYQQGVQDTNEEVADEDNLYSRSKKVYEALKADADQDNLYLYQELEDDILSLREQYEKERQDIDKYIEMLDKGRLPYESHIRNICRTFIYWSKIFSDPSTEENLKYFVSYSKAILQICQALVVC